MWLLVYQIRFNIVINKNKIHSFQIRNIMIYLIFWVFSCKVNSCLQKTAMMKNWMMKPIIFFSSAISSPFLICHFNFICWPLITRPKKRILLRTKTLPIWSFSFSIYPRPISAPLVIFSMIPFTPPVLRFEVAFTSYLFYYFFINLYF